MPGPHHLHLQRAGRETVRRSFSSGPKARRSPCAPEPSSLGLLSHKMSEGPSGSVSPSVETLGIPLPLYKHLRTSALSFHCESQPLVISASWQLPLESSPPASHHSWCVTVEASLLFWR